MLSSVHRRQPGRARSVAWAGLQHFAVSAPPLHAAHMRATFGHGLAAAQRRAACADEELKSPPPRPRSCTKCDFHVIRFEDVAWTKAVHLCTHDPLPPTPPSPPSRGALRRSATTYFCATSTQTPPSSRRACSGHQVPPPAPKAYIAMARAHRCSAPPCWTPPPPPRLCWRAGLRADECHRLVMNLLCRPRRECFVRVPVLVAERQRA